MLTVSGADQYLSLVTNVNFDYFNYRSLITSETYTGTLFSHEVLILAMNTEPVNSVHFIEEGGK